jgi:hypothetical protein
VPPDRRSYHRYTPVDTAYAALGASYFNVGKITDFSKGGLAFEYLESRNGNGNGKMVDVFLIDSPFHIYNLPCKVIYDVSLYPEEGENEVFKTRKCGLHFIASTELQEEQIITFIRQYTIE